LHVRDEEMRAYRKSLGKPEGLLRVVVTRSGRVASASRFFDDSDAGAGRIIATTDEASEEDLAAVAGRAEIWRVGASEVRLQELLERLAGRGVERVLLEGGGELNWALVREDLVDELYVTIVPALLGGREAPTLLEGDGFTMDRQRRLRLESVREISGELFCRYSLLPR
jgi:2,5-diamino-6-(ribosylamino)-4(3H)-pyrimidinone 5'-phosphate reductase